jgi:Tol biopolymer transport system component
MRRIHGAITRRDAIARLAAGGAALAWASKGRADDEKERPPARIYVSTSGRQGEYPPEVSGILAIDPKDGTWTQVLPESYLYSRVSPDGRWLLCIRSRPVADRGVYVYDMRGGDPPRKVADFGTARAFWSGDGAHVILNEFSRDFAERKLVRLNRDGSGRVELPIPATENLLAVSPDGRWFLTGSRRPPKDGEAPNKHRTYLMHPDGTGDRLLLETDRINNFHAFSPDGRTLIYTLLERDGNGPFHGPYRIEMIGVDGKDRRTFLDHDGDEGPYTAVWSPDGKELAVLFREDRLEKGEEVSRDKTATRLEIIGADGKRRRRLDVLKDIRFFPSDWR